MTTNGSSGRYLGTVLKARPALLRWHDTPFTRAGIAARWMAWLANGWRPTTAAAVTLAAILALACPWLLAVAAAAGFWVVVAARRRLIAGLIGMASLVGAVWWTWVTADPLVQVVMVGLVGVWPVDALVGAYSERVRLWRLWCEFRRGFPIRYAIMAAKAQQIQGVIGGERTLVDGRRPILDHPAIGRRPVFEANTAWALCSVPPGRNAFAFVDVVEELSASYVHVQRMDLVFVDDHQTYGYLVVTFGPPLLETAQTPHRPPSRASQFAHTAAAHAGVAVALAGAIWAALT